MSDRRRVRHYGGGVVSALRRGRRPWRFRRRLVLGCVLMGTFTVLVWGWRIREVRVDGAALVPNAAVRDASLAALAERRWGIIPRTSILLGGHRRHLRKRLGEQYAFERIDVRTTSSGDVAVIVVERPTVAWVLAAGAGGAFLAETGAVIGTAPSDESAGGERAHGPVFDAGAPLPVVGTSYLSPDALHFVRRVWAVLVQTGGSFAPERVVRRGSLGTVFDIVTRGQRTITVSSAAPVEQQLAKLQVVLGTGTVPQGSAPPATAATQAIDLRFGDRVYLR